MWICSKRYRKKYPLHNGFDPSLRGNDLTMHWSFDSTLETAEYPLTFWKWGYWWRCSSATDVSSSTWMMVYEYACILYVYFTCLYIDTYPTDHYLPGTHLSFVLPPKRRVFSNQHRSNRQRWSYTAFPIWPEEWIPLFWDSPVFTVF